MTRRLSIAIGMLAMLAACNGRREAYSVTGAYGEGMLAGEVVMAGPRAATPAGVEVSVRGTGMSTILGHDGQFAFAGVPAGADLDFRRAADGIEASLRVESAGFVTVELAKTSATKKSKGSRRRGVGGARDVYEFEGVIRSADSDGIVLFTSKKEEQEIALAAETVIRKGNRTLTAADLGADMRVHVKARKSGETFTAVLVIVQQDGGDGGGETAPAAREYEGTVRSASAAELVVFTSHQREETFAIDGDTVIRKGNTPVAAEDLEEGWRVHVKASVNADGTVLTATRVTVQSTKVK